AEASHQIDAQQVEHLFDAEDPIAVGQMLRAQQSDFLVMANTAGSDAGQGGDVADQQLLSHPLTLQLSQGLYWADGTRPAHRPDAARVEVGAGQDDRSRS